MHLYRRIISQVEVAMNKEYPIYKCWTVDEDIIIYD